MENSAPSTQSSIERRQANDSQFYSEEEFKDYYGQDKYKEKWNAAHVCGSDAPVGSNDTPNSSVAQPANSLNAPAKCTSEIWLESPGNTAVKDEQIAAILQEIAKGLEVLRAQAVLVNMQPQSKIR